jgi:hypothetical protein
MVKKRTGKGKKYCQSCQELCGAAAKVCWSCNAPFKCKKKKVVEELPAVEPGFRRVMRIPVEYDSYQIRHTVSAPAGECPTKIKDSFTEEDVNVWANKVRIYFLTSFQQFLTNNALLYFARQKLDWKSDEYKLVKEYIDNIQDVEIITRPIE